MSSLNEDLAILKEFLYMYRIKDYVYSIIELKLYVLDNVKNKELNDKLICIFFDRSLNIEKEIARLIEQIEDT